jgi:uracil-DNA glycosylase
MLTAIGETRETVSVTNIVKCVMPSGSIHQHAATYYADWKNILVDELVALQPEVVVLLGREVGVLFDIDGPWTVVKVKHPAWYLYENRSPDLTEWNCVKKAINASKYNTRLSSFTGNREGAGEGENDEHH